MIKIYICNDCGYIFENPKVCRDYYDFWGRRESIEGSECPCCDSGDFGEAARCASCGKYVPESDLYFSCDGKTLVCEDCLKEGGEDE